MELILRRSIGILAEVWPRFWLGNDAFGLPDKPESVRNQGDSDRGTQEATDSPPGSDNVSWRKHGPYPKTHGAENCEDDEEDMELFEAHQWGELNN